MWIQAAHNDWGVGCLWPTKLFNSFYSRFEGSNFSEDISNLRKSLDLNTHMVISQEQVSTLFKRVNTRKAAGPDGICGRTLRHCADQLSMSLPHFLMCTEHGQLPKIWKSSIIIPVPKSKYPKKLIYFRPVALTSLVMKNLEKILKDEVTSPHWRQIRSTTVRLSGGEKRRRCKDFYFR